MQWSALFVVFFMKILVGTVLPSLTALEFSSGLINDLPQLFDADIFDDVVLDKMLLEAWQCPRRECFSETSRFFREMHKNDLLYRRCEFWNGAWRLLALQGL